MIHTEIAMKIFGIIAEYNPFHNGHKYLIDKASEYGATHIAAVMSGNFVQRGETALTDKFARADMAVRCGVDLVMELPVAYSLSTAEFFAKGAVSVLNGLRCIDGLIFGAETSDISLLEDISVIAEGLSESEEIKNMLRSGLSYPAAIERAVTAKYGKKAGSILASPNNLLAVEYLKALRYYSSMINPYVVERRSVGHDSLKASDGYASASLIRKLVKYGNNVGDFVPRLVASQLEKAGKHGSVSDMKKLYPIIMQTMRSMSREDFEKISDMPYDLAGRFYSAAKTSGNYDEFIKNVNAKRYTESGIRRLSILSMMSVKTGLNRKTSPYARVLAFNQKGCEIMKEINKASVIPVSSSLADLSLTSEKAGIFAELESRASDIYSMTVKKTPPVGDDYRKKITKQ